MKHHLSILSIACLCLSLATASAAQGQLSATAASSSPASIPHLVKFSGTVKDEDGHPKNGVVGITFALYKDQQGGAPLWLETQNVQTDSKGSYSVLLGSSSAEGLPTDIFTSNDARWLGVQVEGQQEQPRTLLVSAPYALKAGDAETLGGKPLSAFQLAAPQSSASSAQQSAQFSTGSSQQSAALAEQANEIICASGTGCKAAFVPLFTSNGGSAKVSNSIITQTGRTVSVSGEVVGQTGFFRGANSGAIFQATQTNNGAGVALAGVAEGTSGIGVQGAGVTGVLGQALLNGTGVEGTGGGVGVKGEGSIAGAIGVWGEATSNSGVNNGVFGEIFSSSSDAAGVLGTANATSGTTYGVRGINSSSSQFAAGVEGENFATSGSTIGLVGFTSSPTGTGAIGLSDGESNTGAHLIGCCSAGVWGDTGSNVFGATALAGTADDARAIYLENNSTQVPTALMQQDAPNQLALAAGGPGNFCTIDSNAHLFCPGGTSVIASVDAGQRQVALYAVQSPQNWFEDFGSGHLASGTARVTLDFSFAQTVNVDSDYHVFLTPAGECRGLYVTNKTANGFEVREIGGGQSNVAFDYRIVALRRGFETVRLTDMTEQVKKVNAPLPKFVNGPRISFSRPRVPGVSAKSTLSAPEVPR